MQILWRANFFDTTGFSQAARGLVLGLDALGVNVKIENMDFRLPRVELDPQVQKKLEALLTRNKENNFISISHSPPNLFTKKKPHISVGYTYMETSQMVSTYLDQCNEMDGIWVPSRHNFHYIKKSGVTVPVNLVRQGIQIENKNLNPAQEGVFTFLSIFQWSPRKGYDLLLRAFFEEFNKNEDVILVIKTNKMGWGKNLQPYVLDEIEKFRISISHGKQTAPVHVITDLLSQSQMHELYKKSNAFVLPSRGEAVGLPYLEAGGFGLPVIATRWGGQTDFLEEENSYLIDYQLVPIPEKWYTGFYNKGQWWAEPDLHDLKKKMRHVYNNYQEAQKKGELLKMEIANEYNWEKAGSDVIRAVRGIRRDTHVGDPPF